ncbi:uncharacterized protein LOC131589688 [Poecile atricapillus]|uniref:uncharacterized protein LOC131589688 n=1 Tax=Poecile atricapillus TaxID=48891 RepID=UPI002739D092|nr:uncharacterized protein LOC131589688 [Poecile atricapillus]
MKSWQSCSWRLPGTPSDNTMVCVNLGYCDSSSRTVLCTLSADIPCAPGEVQLKCLCVRISTPQLFTTINRGVTVTLQGRVGSLPCSGATCVRSLSPARGLCWTVMLLRHCRTGNPWPWVTLGPWVTHGVAGGQPRPGVLLWRGRCQRIAGICTTHQSMARAEAAAALQLLSRARGKSSPIRGIPGHCSALGACPHSSGFGTLSSLPFSTHLVQGLWSLVLSHGWEWLGVNPTPGQCGALLGVNPTPGQCGALLGVAGGEPHTRAVWGSAGALLTVPSQGQLHSPVPPRPLCATAGCSSCSSCRAPAPSPGTGPLLPSPSTALSLQVCSQLMQHKVCPRANP